MSKFFNTHSRSSRLLLATLLLLLAMPAHLFAAVSARLDRSAIYSGDTVTLHITTSGEEQGKQPDLAPLQNSFDVVSTSSSSRTQIINGNRSDHHEWLIELAPFEEGEITLPAVTVGNSQTAPLTLTVNKQPAADIAQTGEAVFIRSEVSAPQDDVYVQQQILYTTRIYYRVPMIDGSFSTPRVDNAVVEQLGDDRQYQTTIDGRSYNVAERRYAIFPEYSGKLTIGPVVFSGRMESQTRQRPGMGGMDEMMKQMLSRSGIDKSIFDSSFFANPGKQIRVRSSELTLDIKPRPDAYTGSNWLPTPQLLLQDSWGDSPPVVRAGEPVTRTLTIEARGLEASQLPIIQQNESSTLRTYPEQPELSNYFDGDWILGRSEQRFTYVATQAGKLIVPEVRIDWWDSVNQEQHSSVLPAREITVETGSGIVAADPGSEAAIESSEVSAQPEGKSTADESKKYPLYLQVAAGLSALLLLLVLAAVVLMRRRSPPVSKDPQAINRTPAEREKKPAGTSNHGAITHTRKRLHDACFKADTDAAARALLGWAAATWPERPPQSLGALAERVDQGAEAIRELEGALYGANSNSWNSHQLWAAFKEGFKTHGTTSGARKSTDSAPPLYPDWNKREAPNARSA